MSHPNLGDEPILPPEPTPAPLAWSAINPARGRHLDETVPARETPGIRFAGAVAPRDLLEADFVSPRRRRIVAPVVLFLATCGTTFLAGALGWKLELLADTDAANALIWSNVNSGLIYMAAVVGILLTHEMGHFVQTLRNRVPASLPIFLPVPLMTGTMGAVILMEGSRANRKQLFDIGISGPLAGLAVALPIIWFGIKRATVVTDQADAFLGDPLIFKLLTHFLRPELDPGAVLNKFDTHNPLLMAGWVGMLITGLNMMPISQLDGGHVIYGLFGRNAHLVARTFLIVAILFVVFGEHYNWIVMLVLVILLGVDHPPTRDDSVELGWGRRLIGLASLTIPIFCFTPILL